MSSSHHSVNGQVLVQVREQLLRTGGVAPVPHQIAHNREERDELYTSLLHACVCCVTYELRVSTAGFNVGKDGVALGAEGEGEESGANVCGDAADDDLGLVCGADSGLEVLVVPGAGRLLADCTVTET